MSHQIGNHLAGLFRQIGNYLAGVSRQIAFPICKKICDANIGMDIRLDISTWIGIGMHSGYQYGMK